MHIIIMAAGKGVRMGEHTSEGPKALLKVDGRFLGDYLLSSLKPFAPAKVTVVGGFYFDRLVDALKPQYPDVEFVVNKDFEKGNLLSVIAAFRSMGGDDVCLLNADHLFSPSILGRFFGKPDAKIEKHHAGCLKVWRGETFAVACDFDRPLTDDDMKVSFAMPGVVKEMKKTLTAYDAGYVGVTLIPRDMVVEYQKAAQSVRVTLGESTSAEAVINHLAAIDHEIKVLDVSGSSWVEVDTPEDFARAQKIIPALGIA